MILKPQLKCHQKTVKLLLQGIQHSRDPAKQIFSIRGNSGKYRKGGGAIYCTRDPEFTPPPLQPPTPGCTTPIPSGGREGNKSYIFVATSRGLCSFLEFEFFKGSGSPEPNNPSPPCDLHFACTGHAIGCATRNSCLEV